MEIVKTMLNMEMENFFIQMGYVMKDNSKIIKGMDTEFFALIKYKFIEASGKMMNCQDKER